MHSIILNGAEVGDFCIIGANTLVTAGTKIPPYSLVMGSPVRIIKPLNEEQIESIKRNAERYVILKDEYLKDNP